MSRDPRSITRYIIRPLAGISVLVALVFFAGPSDILATWENYNSAWLFIAAIAILCSTILGSYNLYLILNPTLSIRFRQFLSGYWLAWATGLVVPGQIGDVLGLTIWMKRRGFKWEVTSGIAIIDKLITLVWMSVFALGGLWFLLPHISIISYWPYLCAVIIAVTIATICYSRRENSTLALSVVGRVLYEFKRAFANAKKEVLINFCLTPIKIAFIAIAYWAVFRSAGVATLALDITVLLIAAASLVSYIPVSFNGIGTVELTGIAIFGVYQIEPPLVLSVFITLRVLVFSLAWIPSTVLLLLPSDPAH